MKSYRMDSTQRGIMLYLFCDSVEDLWKECCNEMSKNKCTIKKDF